MRRLICALAIITIFPATTLAAEPQIVEATTRCPLFGPHQACLQVSIIPHDPPSGDPYASYDYAPQPSYPDPKLIGVRGRLNGGPARRFLLRVTRRDDQIHGPTPPELAYLGQSPADHVVILTMQGSLEILTPRFAPSSLGQVFMDERTWTTLDMRFIESSSGEIVVTSRDDIGVWDEKRGLCVSGLVPKRERLRIIANGCRARPGSPPELGTPEHHRMIVRQTLEAPRNLFRLARAYYASRVTGIAFDQILELNTPHKPAPEPENRFGNVEPAPLAFDQVKKLFPDDVNEEMEGDGPVSDHYGGMGTGIDIERIKGSHILILTITHDDC